MRSVSTILAVGLLALSGCGGGGGGSVSGGTTAPDKPVVAAVPTSLVIYSGNAQNGNKGATLGEPLCTNVLDAAGHRLYGIRVTYTVITGDGHLAEPTAPVTDGVGIATSGQWTLGPAAGTQTVVASSAGVPSVTFTAIAN